MRNYPLYVYRVWDPRPDAPLVNGEHPVIWVGESNEPWVAIQRHLYGSNSKTFTAWSQSIAGDFPEGMEILTSVMLDKWQGREVIIDPPAPGVTRLEWEIIDQVMNPTDVGNPLDKTRTVSSMSSSLNRWIKHYRDLGHPLLNGRRGRPRGSWKAAGLDEQPTVDLRTVE